MQSYTSDITLFAAFQQGDETAFKFFYDRQYLFVFRFAKKFVVNRQVAEDITTDVFLKCWEKRSDFEDIGKLHSFLFTSSRNACLNYLRDEKRHASTHAQLLSALPDETESSLALHPVTELVIKYIEEEIGKLPVKMKNILRLHLQGKKNGEIALELGMAEKTVRNLKSEAVKLLRIAVIKNELIMLLLSFCIMKTK